MSHARLKIAVVQFSPKIGRVEENIRRAEKICADIQPRSVDLLCLPEMSFSGYVFANSKAISPVLESPQTGPTSVFCAQLAARLQCHVAAGYPERLEPNEQCPGNDNDGNPVDLVGANSAVLYGPEGTWIGNYRKTNLFRVDKSWAKPGTGFATYHLPPPLGTVTVGICMDLNSFLPDQHWAIDGPYEIAQHCIDTDTNVLLLLNAWLDSQEDQDSDEDWPTLNFWAARLRPLWNTVDEPSDGVDVPGSHAPTTTVVICNRTGDENGSLFAGSSSLFHLQRGAGKARLVEVMGRTEEGLRTWTV
ncbi:carbon-nitrogen hydrolase [Auriscalpium vulgare]|uniref:Carbon-nitrogen hydrolase n=1 Tax=Auriscalpium vulgare TaxID=40419 RepID=A0ACB8S3H3_9AGAM|nr:carbon-nitrogen hydrolase [Auriscalpium vulgare]